MQGKNDLMSLKATKCSRLLPLYISVSRQNTKLFIVFEVHSFYSCYEETSAVDINTPFIVLLCSARIKPKRENSSYDENVLHINSTSSDGNSVWYENKFNRFTIPLLPKCMQQSA